MNDDGRRCDQEWDTMCETSTRQTFTDPGDPELGIVTLAGRAEGTSWVIGIAGELDISCADAVGVAFAGVPAQCDRIVLDAGAVTFVDCGGLDALLRGASSCGREVWLRSPSRPVRWVADLAGLTGQWNTAASGEIRLA
jgi:anti-anti-sigma factor